MGRTKISENLKKVDLSVVISTENSIKLRREVKNKSKLVNQLLKEHFGIAETKSKVEVNNGQKNENTRTSYKRD